MQGYWKDGRYILASTLEERMKKLEAENEKLKTFWEYSRLKDKEDFLREWEGSDG